MRPTSTRKCHQKILKHDKNKTTSTLLTNSIKNREIILQSEVALLKNPSTQKQIEGKMILDTGSQRSHVSQKVDVI